MENAKVELSLSRFFDRKTRVFYPYLLLLPAIIMISLIFLYPLVSSILLSFTQYNLTRPTRGKVFIGLHNFRRVFADPVFQIALKNTLIYTFFTIAFEFALGLTLAMFLYKKKKGIGLVRSILLIPMMVAYIVTGLMWKFMYLPEGGFINSALNLVEIKGPAWLSETRWAMPALIIMSVWKNTPFVFLILLAALQSLSPEYFEAAVIDGASGWQILSYITLPLLQPIIFVILVLRLTDAIRIFDEVFVMTRGGPGYATETMSLYIYNTAFESFNMGYAAATSYIMIGITVLFSYTCYRLLYRKETM